MTTRRTFLGATAVTAATLPNLARSAVQNRTLQFGLIGAGGYGMVDSKAALKAGGVEIAAVCDVDSEHLRGAADDLAKLQGSRPAVFKHHEELLDQKGLDGVIIASPPQWHALHFLDALDRVPAVYAEKPLSYDIREGRAMVDAAEASDTLVQIGFQRRQSAAFQQVKKFIAEGGIGDLVQVDAQIHYQAGTKDPTPQAPPESLDWDLWCGPAPKLPYSPQIGHKSWRLEKTTGHGHLVDWGIHLIDATRMVLDLAMPREIIAAGGLYQYDGIITTPDTLTVHFEFDRCPVVWRHRLWGAEEYTPETKNGIFFFGTKGTVFAADRSWTFIPKGKSADRQTHDAPCDLGGEHMAAFLAAVRGGGETACRIADAFRSTATVQLGMIAYETGTRIVWNEKTEEIPGNKPASRLLKREYRKPYVHPYAG